jgi:hypothetical protein
MLSLHRASDRRPATRWGRARCLGAVLVLGAACTSDAAPLAVAPAASSGERPPAPKPDPSRSEPTCLGPLEAPLKLRAAAGTLTLGVLAGLKDSDDENLASLRGLALDLQRRGAEALVANGDVGDTAEAQVALLSALTATGLPVLVQPGNRELRADLDAAVAEVRRRGGKLTDLSHTRLIDLGDALLAGLPGGFERRQVRSEGACLYVQRDVELLAGALDKLQAGAAPTILVAPAPPRGEGARALDFSEGQNLGDPRLATLLTPQRAQFGLFGQVWESGGRAVDGAGKPVAPGAPAAQLYLNPGAADRTTWPMSDGSSANGLAALFTLRGRTATYEVVRAPTAAKTP